ncbi:MAG TPA: DUF2798 domain-containing protein [Casimicrobiaceae bacterium]|nr:DUF2798 domain-containing protein [Casimicrobiaceae bacterium]
MIPKRFAPLIFAAALTCIMTLVISGIATLINVGLPPDFFVRWVRAWLPNWAIACPVLLVVRPYVQRFTEWVTA